MDEITGLARKRNQCPDRFYNQLNGKSAFDNYINQKVQNNKSEQMKTEEINKSVSSAIEDMIKQIMR